MEKTLIFECRDHGTFTDETRCCPKCAEEVANKGPVKSIQLIMGSSLEALAKRLK